MTAAEIMAAVAFFVMLSGAAWGIWWRIDGKVTTESKNNAAGASAAAALASLALEKLADHKLHVAETYVSKAGLREAVEPIMDAIQGVKGAVDHLGGRIDGMYHAASTPRRKPTS